MGAKGMVLFVAIVALLFPLAAIIVSDYYRNAQKQPLGNPSNLETTMDVETFELLWTDCGTELTHSVESLQDLQSRGIDKSPIPVPIRRKLAESNCKETPKLNGQTLDIEPVPFAVSKAVTDGTGITNTTIIIAVVSTSVVTFLLATLLFCWYTRAYSGVKNDEKPLLSLSTSASQKPSYSVQKSNKNFGNGGDQLLSAKSDIRKTMSSVNSSVSLGIPQDPPPGNLTVAGIAPLKPPPGRPDLALKTPPGMKDLSVPPHNTPSPPSRSPAGGGGGASVVPSGLSPSLPPGAAHFSLRGPSRAVSARRPPLAAPPPPPPAGKAPPPPPPLKQGPRPPPPPGGGVKAPPRPPGVGSKTPRPPTGEPDGDDVNKAKLKPFFWDKVMANPDQAMVWHQIRAGSFQFNEEMIENLFGYNANDKNKSGHKKSSQDPSSSIIQIIDAKKAQNLSILLKALGVTTNEVCDALKEGNELPVELIQTLIKSAPSGEEEMKLRLYNGDISRLGTAEKFLKRLVEIPFAFKRLESLLFMCTLQEEEDFIKESFQTLETACIQLKKSRLFLKLLEAVLKTGNRMNDGTFRGSAQAFKLDTLLKLSDVKGIDGKTTLLHFVVVEIIRAEGVRAAKTDNLLEEAANSSDPDEYYRNLGLLEVSRLCGELEDVKRAAIIDADGLTGTVSRFGQALTKAREFLDTDLKNLQENRNYEDSDGDDEDDDEFVGILSGFVQTADKSIMWMLEEEKRIMALVKKTADYFHGQAGKDEGLRLFVIVRDFLIILDRICKEVKETPLKPPPKVIEKKDEKEDGSPRSKEETKDGSPRGMKEETKDVVSPRSRESGDLPRQTEGNGDLEHGTREGDERLNEDVRHKNLQDSGKNEDPGHKNLQDSWKSEDVGHETKESEGSREVGEVQDSWKNEDPGHENHQDNLKDEDMGRGTQESEDPRRQVQEIYDKLLRTQEVESMDEIEESDDFEHEAVVLDDSQPKMHDDDYDDDDSSQPETHDDEDSQPKIHDDDDLQRKIHDDDDDDDDDLQRKIHDDDADDDDDSSQSKTHDDSQPKIHDDDDDLQHKIHDDDDDSSQSKTHDDDDSQPITHEDDVDSQPKTNDDDDDLQRKIHEDDDDDDSRPKTRGDDDDLAHDNTQHKTSEDESMEPTTREDDDMEPTTREDDDMELKTLVDFDMEPRKQEYDDMEPKTLDDFDMEPSTQEDYDVEPKTLEAFDMEPSTQDFDDMEPKIKDDDDLQHQTWETDNLEPKNQKDDLQHKTDENDSLQTSESHKSGFRVPHERLIPAIALRRVDTFDSDENSSSDED